MDGRKKSGSSLTSDLFGSKDSGVAAASSSGIFGTIFAPPAKAVGNDSLVTPEKEKKHNPGSQSWNSKTAVSENNGVNGEVKEDSQLYPVENVHPCNYSSSIYYGGQDIYSPPQTNAQSTVFTTFNKDGGEDDSNGASRGNWWRGMLSIVVKSMYSGCRRRLTCTTRLLHVFLAQGARSSMHSMMLWAAQFSLLLARSSSPLQVNLHILRKIQMRGIDNNIAV